MRQRLWAATLATLSVAGCVGPSEDEIDLIGHEQAIIGGSASGANVRKATVALYDRWGQMCGGTLIAPRWVLTAAHCMNGTDPVTKIVAGRKDLTNTAVGDDILIDYSGAAGVADGVRAYVYYKSDADIALVKLPRPAKMTITPLRLASSTEMASVANGATLTVAGWGTTVGNGTNPSNILLEVDVPKVADSFATACAGNFLCAGGVANKDACHQDSGGPLLAQVNGETIQVGVVSASVFAQPCGTAGNPGTYGRVSAALTWINDTLRTAVADPVAGDDTEPGADVHRFWTWPAASSFPVTSANRTPNLTAIPRVAMPSNYMPLVGQFGGDARPDVFFYQPGSGKDYIYITGVTAPRAVTATANYEPLVGDFDGNGLSDILWYGPGSAIDKVWWFDVNTANVNAPNIVDGTVTVGGTYKPVAGRLNSDNKTDIVWYAPGAGADWIWHNTARSAANALTMTSTQTTLDGDFTLLLGNFNGDAFGDLYLYSTTAVDVIKRGSANTFVNGSWTNFTPTQTDGTTWDVNNAYRPFVGDFDGNGFSDIYWYRPYDSDLTTTNRNNESDSIFWFQTAGGVAGRHQLVGEDVRDGEQFLPLTGDFSGTAAGVARTDDILWYRGVRPRGE